MNARNHMKHRALVERDAHTVRDGYNQKLPPDWRPLATVPCYVWFPVERRAEDSSKTANVSTLRAMMPTSTDITERDSISSVLDRRNVELFTGRLLVELVTRRPDHLFIELRRVA